MKKIILLIIILFNIISCNNDLTEKVYSDLLVESYKYSEDNVNNLLGPVYSTMRPLTGRANSFCLQELAADILVIPANSTGWDNGGMYRRIHMHTWTSEQSHITDMWNSLYKGVIFATRVIEQFQSDVIPIPAEENKDALIAEMRVARAFFYWLILDNFSNPPLIKETTQELPSNSSRTEIYEYIEAEILGALPHLSEDNNVKMYGRFNKWGAKALLANIYLNAEVYIGQSKWDECINECNGIINSGKYILESDYRNNFIVHNENSKEFIFALPEDENYTTNGIDFHLCSLHASSKKTYNLQSTPWGAGGVRGVSQFIDTYDSDDQRLKDTWIMGPQYALDGVTPVYCAYEKKGEQLNYTKDLPDGIYTGENEGYRVGKWEFKIGAKRYLSNDYGFFRFAQVLMMKAECLLRKGQSDQAAAIVTEVRQRDFKNNPDKAVVTGSQLEENSVYSYGYVENYQIVEPGDQTPIQFGRFLDELGWEFAIESYRRRDLIRFGVFTTKSWLSHKPNGDYRTVYPIPIGALDSNPNLEQDPNYLN